MTLHRAVQTYIDGKHARGVVFEEAAKILRSFSKKVGDVPLDAITPAQILDFLNGPQTSYRTWCTKFSLLKFFFEYWSARGLVDRSPMPPRIRPPLALALAFVPYVYTRKSCGFSSGRRPPGRTLRGKTSGQAGWILERSACSS